MTHAVSLRKRSTIFIILAMVAALIPAIALAPPVHADPPSDLVITGVIDGPLSGGVPKAIEVYVINNIADLSSYGLGAATNGGGTDGEEFTFPADSAVAGTHLYVAYQSGSDPNGFEPFFDVEPTYTTYTAAQINGDDAIELFRDGVVVDVFGQIDVDGTNQPWEYLDGWAYRIDGTGPDGSTFQLGSWEFSERNALDGATTNASAEPPFPIGTYSYVAQDLPPTVASTVPASEATLVPISSDITVTFSEDVTVDADWFTLACDTSGAHTAVQTGGPRTFVLNPDGEFSFGEPCTLTVVADKVADLDEPVQAMDANVVVGFDTALPPCQITDLTLIHDVQGDGMASPIADRVVTIEGVVVGDFQTWQALSGFFVQEEDADNDGNSATSEGVFVYDGGNPAVDVSVGDVVQVTGTVVELYGFTQLTDVSLVDNCGFTDTASPAAPMLPWPASTHGSSGRA